VVFDRLSTPGKTTRNSIVDHGTLYHAAKEGKHYDIKLLCRVYTVNQSTATRCRVSLSHPTQSQHLLLLTLPTKMKSKAYPCFLASLALFSNTSAAIDSGVSGEELIALSFPSSNAVVKGCTLDAGSIFVTKALAGLYPEFGGPHMITETFVDANFCPGGIDRVTLDLGATAEGMAEETVVGFALSINDISVAEGTSSKMDATLGMQDVIYPPIRDHSLKISLEVVFFDGKISSNVAPSGILPNVLVAGDTTLILGCAPAFPAKGLIYGKSKDLKAMSILPNKKKTLGKLQHGFKKCGCLGRPLALPSIERVGPLYPKQKFYENCHDHKPVLLPIPNEPFESVSDRFLEIFSLSNSKFKMKKVGYEMALGLYLELCGGQGLNSTIRMTDCQCQETPVGYDPLFLAFDFEVHCPVDPPPKGKGALRDEVAAEGTDEYTELDEYSYYEELASYEGDDDDAY
jgi:hypothetical protein